MEAFAFEQLTVGTPVKTLTESIYAVADLPQCHGAEITMTEGSISYRKDGTDPSSTAGHLFVVGDDLRILSSINEVRRFKAVRVGDSDAKLAISYKY